MPGGLQGRPMGAREAARWSDKQNVAPVIGDDLMAAFLEWRANALLTEEEEGLIRVNQWMDNYLLSKFVCWLVTTPEGQTATSRIVYYPKQRGMFRGDVEPWDEVKD